MQRDVKKGKKGEKILQWKDHSLLSPQISVFGLSSIHVHLTQKQNPFPLHLCPLFITWNDKKSYGFQSFLLRFLTKPIN